MRDARPRRAGASGDDDERQSGHRQRGRVAASQAEVDARALAHQLRGSDAGRAAGERRERENRNRAAQPEARPEHQPEGGIPHREADPGEGPDPEREDEGREADPEEHAIEHGGHWHRHHPPPVLGQLTTDLRHDPGAPGLEGGREQRDPRRDQIGGAPARPVQQVSQDRQGPERDQAARDRSGQERDAGGDRRPPAAGVAGGPDRVDHRKPAGREGAGRSDQQGGDSERDLERPEHQQGTRVS